MKNISDKQCKQLFIFQQIIPFRNKGHAIVHFALASKKLLVPNFTIVTHQFGANWCNSGQLFGLQPCKL